MIKDDNLKQNGKFWKKIKDILYSEDRILFLNNFKPIELNLFEKEYNGDNNSIIKYMKLNPNLQNVLNKEISFDEIMLNHPLDKYESTKDIDTHYFNEKIDNTGNYQIWPSEEILSVYCLLNHHLFENKKIIELGSGFSGLCGIIIAKHINIKEMLLTDGNNKCVETLKENIKINNLKNTNDKVLLWNREINYKQEFKLNDDDLYDFILISDCLFFKNFHIDLVHTINSLLKQNGKCLIISPERGKTMDMFLELVKDNFFIKKSKEEISFIKYKNEDSKFDPFFIELIKK